MIQNNATLLLNKIIRINKKKDNDFNNFPIS